MIKSLLKFLDFKGDFYLSGSKKQDEHFIPPGARKTFTAEGYWSGFNWIPRDGDDILIECATFTWHFLPDPEDPLEAKLLHPDPAVSSIITLATEPGKTGKGTVIARETFGGSEDGEVDVEVLLEVMITELGFTNDHQITEWIGRAAIDSPDGSKPVWRRGSYNPDDPVCYTKNTVPTMFAVFTVSPEVTIPITGVKIRAKVGTTVVGSASNLTIYGAVINDAINKDGDVDGIGRGSPVPGSYEVGTTVIDFDWEFSLDGGVTWRSARSSGPHTMHWIYASPKESPLFDRALEKALRYVDGEVAPRDITAAIRRGIHSELGRRYHPGGKWYWGDDVLHLYDTGTRLICSTYANLMAYLCRSVGLPASVYWVWGGTQKYGFVWKYTGWLPPNRDKRGTILVDPGRWMWGWHAVASTPEGYSDAALGESGVNVVHHYPGGSVQKLYAGAYMRLPEELPFQYRWTGHYWP